MKWEVVFWSKQITPLYSRIGSAAMSLTAGTSPRMSLQPAPGTCLVPTGVLSKPKLFQLLGDPRTSPLSLSLTSRYKGHQSLQTITQLHAQPCCHPRPQSLKLSGWLRGARGLCQVTHQKESCAVVPHQPYNTAAPLLGNAHGWTTGLPSPGSCL